MLLAAGAARAIDLTNTWAVSLGGNPCNWSIAQTGTALTFSGGTGCSYLSVSGVGTIDSTTGAFTANGTIVFPGFPPIFDGIAITAVAAPAGTSFAGTATTSFGPTPIAGSLCRNGNLDPGEACDDGTNPQGCCTNTCTPEPDGQACTQPPHDQCATATTCAAGACVGAPTPAGTPCDADFRPCTHDACDGAGACSFVECSPCCDASCLSHTIPPCAGPANGRSFFLLKTGDPDGADRLVFRLPGVDGVSVADFGDPTTTTDYALCVIQADEDLGTRLLLSARAPAASTCGGRPCWKATRRGFRYADRRRTSDGLASVVASATGGTGRFRVIGRGSRLSPSLDPIFSYPDALWVQLRTADRCWGAFYPVPEVAETGLIRATGGE
jgi:hypothetical protein